MKTAIVVGHDSVEKGAYSHLLKQSEFSYNSKVAELIGYDTYFRPTKGDYTAKIKQLAKEINKKDYDLVIELHFNSFNGIANGSESLYYYGSVKGKQYAEMFIKAIENEYKTVNRGAKSKLVTDRGGLFLKSINAPAIILEPFFGDNKECLDFSCHSRYAELIKSIF